MACQKEVFLVLYDKVSYYLDLEPNRTELEVMRKDMYYPISNKLINKICGKVSSLTGSLHILGKTQKL